MVDERKVVDSPPQNAWLKGYFFLMPEHELLGGDRTLQKMWKNIDYMRLRDVPIQLLMPLDGKRVLDLGCSDGASMVYCGLQGAEVAGVDLDAAQVAGANSRLREFGIKGAAYVADATALPFGTNEFDAVISTDFFEHVERPDKVKVLREALRVSKPGAAIVIKTPNLSYLRLSLLQKRLRAVLRFRDPRRIVIPHSPQHDDPIHIGLTTRGEMTKCLVDAGYLNYRFTYAPNRRFGLSALMELLSVEVPLARDLLCEDVMVIAYKPIALSHFPD